MQAKPIEGGLLTAAFLSYVHFKIGLIVRDIKSA